jgi:hypothetical protein
MTDSDLALRNAIRRAQAEAVRTPVPDFEQAWTAASARARALRKRQFLLAGCATALVALALAYGLRAPMQDEMRYIDEVELLGTTGWTAPSDSLLPIRAFDIYQTVPVLIESTETYEGALL